MADDALVSRIGVVLPPRETFLVRKSGAVALCMRDYARFSKLSDRIDILGAGPCDYSDVRYRRLTSWRRWWRRDRSAYADAVAAVSAEYALFEIQNRPYLIPAIRRRAPHPKLTLHLHNDAQTMDGSRSASERQRLLDACDAVYCVSEFIRGRFLEGVSDRTQKALTVLNGIALPQDLPEKERVIAFTGRILPIKGVFELVRAFQAADLPGWRLAIAGDDADRRLAGMNDDRIDFLGQLSHADAMALLARAEIAAVPSMWDEPGGRAAIEALASGCALIASRRGGLSEIAGEDAVLYIDPADPSAFVEALGKVALDDEFRRGLQARGRAVAAQRLAIGISTARLDKVRARLLQL